MRIAALVAVCLLVAGTANSQTVSTEAVEQDAIITSDSNTAKLTYKAGTSRIEVGAQRSVDIEALLVSARIRPNDDPQTIVEKVDAVRKRLYLDAEIA